MKSILKLNDVSDGDLVIVIPKIREVVKAMGNAVIVYDNGNKRTINTDNANKTIEEIAKAIESFYGGIGT